MATDMPEFKVVRSVAYRLWSEVMQRIYSIMTEPSVPLREFSRPIWIVSLESTKAEICIILNTPVVQE